MSELYNVYDKAIRLNQEDVLLLPIAHSTAKAQLEVTIDGEGNFKSADIVLDNKDAVTVIPVTEDSGARANGISPHPFADKLIYIAGDYCRFCSVKKADEEKYPAYMKQLLQWKNSEFTHPSVDALYQYLSKGALIQDLIEARILKVDKDGRLTADKIEKIAQVDCFVRFRVNGESREQRTWLDKTLYNSFIAYNASTQGDKAFCYATGEYTICTYKHPSKILNAGDKGKLFSANDESGLSYRGRFLNKTQTVSIGYEFSQKMHNALKWLIERQGNFFGNLTLVAWNSVLGALPKFANDSQSILADYSGEFDDMEFESFPETFASYKGALKKAVFSYNYNLKFEQKIMILMLDEATTGRISVNMYSELPESEFYENVTNWHLNTTWRRYDFNEKKVCFTSFALLQIIEYAYGTDQKGKLTCESKLKSDMIARMLPCVIEGRRLPKDILRQTVHRASRPTAFTTQNNWRRMVEIACAMIRKNKIEEGEECSMALDTERNTRSYLYGRLLAVAEVAEAFTYGREQTRPTNAEKYFEKFSNAPYITWGVIYNRLKPYLNGMKINNKVYYQRIIDEVMDKFLYDDFADNSKLEPEFLLGYSSQRYVLCHPDKSKNNNENVDN